MERGKERSDNNILMVMKLVSSPAVACQPMVDMIVNF